MHEMMFAQKILREARRAGACEKVKVEVGELCEVTADELRDGLLRLSSGVLNPDDLIGKGILLNNSSGNGMSFEVNEVESKISCVCGFEGRAEIVNRGHGYCLFACPDCGEGGKKVKVLAGGEIKIVGVE